MVNPLARVIMEKNLKTEKVINSRAVNQKETTEGNNLDDKEIKIISDIIKGEKEVIEGSKKNTAITLEEAANRMKNNR
ncbi:hypothetical protein ACF3M2_08255 [Tissierella carlieri]|jgi:hypothetical protein|uniref:hypothetical protein n=1 Tax=Tissierella carlieri TaxID=689904 RepID=UPI00291487B2|nr:hypothetical protein [Bacillota bacterium]MDU5146170.1 hypothetical protein [Paenibacillus dendritiformis]